MLPFSSPLRGISISTLKFRISEIQNEAFRPLFGVSLFLLNTSPFTVTGCTVFVPSSGYLYFYKTLEELRKEYKRRFRSLYEVSLFLRIYRSVHGRQPCKFSSPLRGISISTYMRQNYGICWERFRPLYGVSLFLQGRI